MTRFTGHRQREKERGIQRRSGRVTISRFKKTESTARSRLAAGRGAPSFISMTNQGAKNKAQTKKPDLHKPEIRGHKNAILGIKEGKLKHQKGKLPGEPKPVPV